LVQVDGRLQPIVNQAGPTRRSRSWNGARVTDHHAIIPTTGTSRLELLRSDGLRVYDLILRCLAPFFGSFVYDHIVIDVDFELSHNDFSRDRFGATGRRIADRGWKVVVEEREDDELRVPTLAPVQTGTGVLMDSARAEERATNPSTRFTDGTLMGAMSNVARFANDEKLRKMLREAAGLGIEATRVSIIETLVGRGLIKRQSRHLISTPLGRALVDALPAPIKDPAMTALWEQSLDDIANVAFETVPAKPERCKRQRSRQH
jgi:DNA topoisomerase-3